MNHSRAESSGLISVSGAEWRENQQRDPLQAAAALQQRWVRLFYLSAQQTCAEEGSCNCVGLRSRSENRAGPVRPPHRLHDQTGEAQVIGL